MTEKKSSCQNKHGSRSEFRKLVQGTYFGVIDVIDMQLKALPLVNGEPERRSYYFMGRSRDEDAYGRTIRPSMQHLNTSDFNGILPDNPFGIIRGPFPSDSNKDRINAMPILQFYTWRTELLVTIRESEDETTQNLPPGKDYANAT
ncbi:hypothetical protein B0T17DRAFT_620177 [Bombardia bombarda]|uniref:Uncharacterized protein n=1 Tax=Bombardia bombarda TaxID=252184 RepID=A0AA39U7K3_9PEZI|nr:hypothetical protein B0T17DRAFT_620177 [Bombardia bombarda]